MCSGKPLEGTPGLPFAMSGLFFVVLLSGMMVLLQPYPVFTQNTSTDTQKPLIQKPISPLPLRAEERLAGMPQDSLFTGSVSRYEINEITFVGNITFSAELLSAIITSRPSEGSIGRRTAGYILRELRRNPASPRHVISSLAKFEKNTDDDIRYFDKIAAGADTTVLAAYYRRNGFHRVQVDYAFIRNPQTRRNALVFRVVENEPTPLDTIAYYGLETVDDDLAPNLAAAQTLGRSTRFNQSTVTEQNERILALLRDNGYHTARYRKPILSFIEDENRDSVTVVFDVGKRKRISGITYLDSSASYTYLSPSVQQSLVEIKVGDWYNEAAVVRSVNNLYNFGLFDLAIIDTASRAQLPTDSTLALRVLTRTRRIHNTDIGMFIGQIANTSLLELGANARYENKNLFGSAQTLSLQAQIALVDVNTFVNNLLAGKVVNARLEGLLSARFAYPLFVNLFGRRVDLESRLSYSLQSLAFVSLAAPLLLETGKFYASLPMVLPQVGLLNSLFLEINLDRQRPINFENTREQALALARTPAERTVVQQQLFQYQVLDALYKQPTALFLTSIILTLGTRGDHRDNLFNPRKGYFVDFSVDGAIPPGASEFVRFSADVRWYETLSKQMVFAARVRAGHTLLLNPERTFVPIERHFFAGGSNSIRAWNVRDLRVRTGEQSAVLPELAFVGQFIGSGSLLEGSVEWRYSFTTESKAYGTFWEQQLSKIGVAGFVDVGNAFNSFLEPTANYGKLPFSNIAQNIAIAAGVGIRYDTSIGPFRVDFALRVYDPATRQFFFQNPTPTLQNLFNVQIGLGHAF